jgi:hypothetical protein
MDSQDCMRKGIQGMGGTRVRLTPAPSCLCFTSHRVRQTTELEVNMNSVERMVEYHR